MRLFSFSITLTFFFLLCPPKTHQRDRKLWKSCLAVRPVSWNEKTWNSSPSWGLYGLSWTRPTVPWEHWKELMGTVLYKHAQKCLILNEKLSIILAKHSDSPSVTSGWPLRSNLWEKNLRKVLITLKYKYWHPYPFIALLIFKVRMFLHRLQCYPRKNQN